MTIQAPGEPLLDTESTRGDDRVSRLTLHFYLSKQTKKTQNLCRCKALRGVSVHLADDEA